MIKSSHALLQHFRITLSLKAAAELSHAFDIMTNMLLKSRNNKRYRQIFIYNFKVIYMRDCFCLRSADRLYSDKKRFD